MRCSQCGYENRKRAKFCGGCGALLGLNCPECGTEISPTDKFCDICGAAAPVFPDRTAAAPGFPDRIPNTGDFTGSRSHASDIAPETAANRRQMSLMSCDLVDSSILAQKLDPEDLRYAINNFHQIAKGIIEQYEGYYAQYMGDGFMAYFSYPIAHEDDAYRAVLAGLRMVEAIRHFNIDLQNKHDIELHLRVGVDTGEVVVDEFVVGEPPNIASRVQAAAAPDTVVITETTKRLLPPAAFTYQDLGVRELKNVGPLRLFCVVERKERDGSEIDTRRARPLIGRRKQLQLLADHWELVKDGIGQAVIVAGEAGIGKSKLIQGFEIEFGAEAYTSLSFHGSPFHRNTMLYPVIENMQLAARILTADSGDAKFSKLHDFLGQFNTPDRMLPLVSRLLSISEEDSVRHIPSQKLLQQTLDILIDMALQYANRGPTLFIFEDIHWFDSTTMNLLELLIPLIRNERAFLLLTTRSTSTPQLQEKFYLTQITLARLRSEESAHLIQAIIGDKALPESIHTQILNKANGVPLYVEELTKMVLDAEVIQNAENHDLISEPDLTIPLTLRDPLTSRVDRVKGRRVLQLAATLGRKFNYELLLAVSSLHSEVLSRELRHLVNAELLYQKGTVLQEATFEFKHSLIRDAAYALLTKAERETYHARAGCLLEERFFETAKAHPEIVAYHYTQGRSYDKALHYWYEAGKQSAARSAHNEAVGHLKQGLKLTPNIDDPLLRNKSELLLQTSLGNSLRATKGWSIQSVKQAYTRAYQLCKESGFDEHTLPAVFGLWTWNFVHAALDEAQALAEHLLNTAENVNDSNYKVLAHEALGFTLFARGRFADAHVELERSIRMCEDSEAAAYLELSAQDPRVHVRLYDGMVLWFLGYPDQALRVCAEARRYADASQHPFSEAMAQTISLRVHQFRGDAAVVAAQADAAIALCEEHEFVHYLAMALILRGWASAQQGEFEKGIAEIQEALEKERATGALLYESYTLGLLADACIKNERFGQAFDFLDQAQLRLDEKNSERFYAAEIYRLLGEAYLRSERELVKAERYLRKGLEVAREQKAKSLELKLSMSLYDLYELREDAESYRPQLAEIYGSFGEGFDTTDLVRAKAKLTNGQSG
jgi:predicted ATPase/class 3 adenylate cyclase